MAYFRCSTGSTSSGDGVALVVACDADFAGSVITATNGTDTFTETCPSVSPYTVRFENIPVGTYTISGVSGGVTVTTQFTVLDYTTSLHNIPTGATVTPVNNIQIWLHCADIWDKTYTTINQVLADASTLQALIASNNAVDYMARSTSWASSVTANANAMTYIGNNNYCANKLLADTTWLNAICNSAYFESVLNVKVPTMTSPTTPYGEVFMSSQYSYSDGYHPAYLVFDGNDATNWASYSSSINEYVGYKFTAPIVVNKCRLVPVFGTLVTDCRVKNFRIEASNDNFTSQIVTLYTGIYDDFTKAYMDIGIANATKYLAYRCYVIDNYTPYVIGILTLQFYGRA